MGSIRTNLLSLTIIGILLTSFSGPVFGEVETIKTDTLFYTHGDTIIFSGNVNEDDTGLVTIVIRDSNDEFVLLTQAFIQADNSFERKVVSNDKFTSHGIYNASAFLVNMTEGSLTQFDFSLDGSPVNPSVSTLQENNDDETTVTVSQTSEDKESYLEPVSKIASFVDTTKDPQHYIDRYNDEPSYKEWFDVNFPGLTIYEAVGLTNIIEDSTTIDFSQYIDASVDPQYYIDRYNDEPSYKEWFDVNFPGLTIYEAVGITPVEISTEDNSVPVIEEPSNTTQKVSKNLVESSTVNTRIDTGNSEVGQMLLALGGLGILFGAVYGVKRKVDNNTVQIKENKTKIEKKVNSNSDQISQNKFWLKKKLMSLKSTEEPMSVIKERLAKGEITVDEYYKLLRALKK